MGKGQQRSLCLLFPSPPPPHPLPYHCYHHIRESGEGRPTIPVSTVPPLHPLPYHCYHHIRESGEGRPTIPVSTVPPPPPPSTALPLLPPHQGKWGRDSNDPCVYCSPPPPSTALPLLPPHQGSPPPPKWGRDSNDPCVYCSLSPIHCLTTATTTPGKVGKGQQRSLCLLFPLPHPLPYHCYHHTRESREGTATIPVSTVPSPPSTALPLLPPHQGKWGRDSNDPCVYCLPSTALPLLPPHQGKWGRDSNNPCVYCLPSIA